MNVLSLPIPEKYPQIVSQLEEKLESGDLSQRKLISINSLQMQLSGRACKANIYPEFFTEKRIKYISSLLSRAAEYLRGTQFEDGAFERIREFKEAVYSTRNAGKLRRYLESLTT